MGLWTRQIDPFLSRSQDYLDFFFDRCRQVFSDKVGSDRELAMASIDENRKHDTGWTPEIDDKIHGRPNGSSGEKDVIDQEDSPVIHGERQMTLFQEGDA